MRGVELTICASVALLVACALDNPCPKGMVRDNTRCVDRASNDAEPIGAEDDSELTDSGGASDADPEVDVDAEIDAQDVRPDHDAGPDQDADPESDAGSGPAECTEEARDTWRQFQMSKAAVPTVLACYATEPACGTGVCDLSSCLKHNAQVDGCDRCVSSEVACTAERCLVPCGILTDGDACRACACAQGCLAAPAGCGTGGVDACADCAGASCSAPFAALTETITIPIFFHLLYDGVDPATGIPAYAAGGGRQETILDIDSSLARLNEQLESARPDARRLRLIRAGVHNVPAPAPGACPDPVAWSDTQRFYGGLNVVLTGATESCPAAAATAYAARASGAALSRALGNMLGIAPGDQGAGEWSITQEQFTRMHNYARWRLGAPDAVPETERQALTGFLHGPADPIWDKLTNRDLALTNASVFEATLAGPFNTLPLTEDIAVATSGVTRRVLGVRVSARFTGTPSSNLRMIVATTGRHRIVLIPRASILVRDGTLLAEEAFNTSSDVPWHFLRNRDVGRTWTVSIEDAAAMTFHDIRLELILGDRYFSSYDRHARGIADILIYRPSTSELLTATNPANGTTAFGASVIDSVPPLPNENAKVFSGDVDGDGHVDLLARLGATIWVSFDKRGFTPWRLGAIDGSAQPSTSDNVVMGDFDGDGFGDLLGRRADLANGVSIWTYHRGFGDGTFEGARTPNFAGAPFPVDIQFTVADLARRGRSDILTRQRLGNHMVISFNDTIEPTTSGALPIFWGGWAPELGATHSAVPFSDRFIVLDANEDGSEDIVSRRAGSAEWFVYRNMGAEVFTAAQSMTIGGSPTAYTDDDVILGSVP